MQSDDVMLRMRTGPHGAQRGAGDDSLGPVQEQRNGAADYKVQKVK